MINLFVVNYNTQDKLQRLLDTLHENDNHLWTLHIADNGSTDGSAEWLKEHAHEYRIHEVLYNDNIGYSAACNQLACNGTGDIYGFLNADVWLKSVDIADIQHSFDILPEQAIMGPKQRDEKGKITHAGIFGTNQAPKHRGWQEPDPTNRKYVDWREAVTVSGAAYFVRSKVWEMLSRCKMYRDMHPEANGAFLPTPHYYEETWCSYHARAHGLEVFYNGRISIGHSWHASSEKGGYADQQFRVSQKIFREACDAHGISHD